MKRESNALLRECAATRLRQYEGVPSPVSHASGEAGNGKIAGLRCPMM